MKPGARNAVTLVVALAVVACAQLQGLDDYEKVDCLEEGCDPDTTLDGDGSVPPLPPGTPDAAGDAPATCPPCTGGAVCDPKSLKCVECLPGTKECAPGQFCDPDEAAGFKCVQGCGTVQDCIVALASDAGTDGGAADAAADATAGGDGGAGTLACCNNRCVDTASNGSHCGVCNNSCGANGACCDSTCLDVVSTPTSCGGCGLSCSGNHVPSPTCGGRACTGLCEDGWADCNLNKLTDGCETDVYTDPNKCGACNKSCSSNHVTTRTCTTGVCTGTCEAGWVDCNKNKLTDGCEIDIGNNPAHCGGCDRACSNNHVPTPACGGGVCNGACEAGWSDCDSSKLINGCETKTSGAGADPDNCGTCGTKCSNNHVPTPTCNGTCNGACEAGWADCFNGKQADGCETNIYADPAHCGACNQSCSSNHIASPTCGGTGQCNGTCESGWRDCNSNKLTDGCETRDLDTAHCTACNVACGTAGMRNCKLVNGTPACTAGYGVTRSTMAWIDACSFEGNAASFIGRYHTAGNDDASTLLPFPPAVSGATGFDFQFAGVTPSNMWFSTNGVLGFSATANSMFSNTCPPPQTTAPLIFGFFDDLQSRSGASFGICAAVTGTAPNRRLVVTWADAAILGALTTHITFSIVLSEGSDVIDVLYNDISNTTSGGATVGLQTGTATNDATVYSCNQDAVVTGTKLRYIP